MNPKDLKNLKKKLPLLPIFAELSRASSHLCLLFSLAFSKMEPCWSHLRPNKVLRWKGQEFWVRILEVLFEGCHKTFVFDGVDLNSFVLFFLLLPLLLE